MCYPLNKIETKGRRKKKLKRIRFRKTYQKPIRIDLRNTCAQLFAIVFTSIYSSMICLTTTKLDNRTRVLLHRNEERIEWNRDVWKEEEGILFAVSITKYNQNNGTSIQ